MPRAASPNPQSFGMAGAVITPGNTDLPDSRAVVCLAAGNVTVVPWNNLDGATLTFTGCPVGFVVPYVVRRVTAATGTWATVLAE